MRALFPLVSTENSSLNESTISDKVHLFAILLMPVTMISLSTSYDISRKIKQNCLEKLKKKKTFSFLQRVVLLFVKQKLVFMHKGM